MGLLVGAGGGWVIGIRLVWIVFKTPEACNGFMMMMLLFGHNRSVWLSQAVSSTAYGICMLGEGTVGPGLGITMLQISLQTAANTPYCFRPIFQGQL